MQRWIAIALLALAAGLPNASAADPPKAEPVQRSVVYAARNYGAIDNYVVRPATVKRMVDGLVTSVTGKPTVVAAWRSLVGPNDVVGIKVSTDGGPLFSTHPAIVDAIAAGLRQAGIPAERIVVWDRDARGLAEAGYRLGRDYTLRTVEPNTGYDREAQVSSALLGKLIWGDMDFQARSRIDLAKPYEEEQLSTVSYLNKVLSKEITKVVNVPTMSTTSTAGLAGCLYNMTVRNVDNWRRFSSPPGYGDPYIPEAYFDERIGGKVVINFMDGLVAQYAGGPSFDPNYALQHSTIYASHDPVAIDATALEFIDSWRASVRLPPLGKRSTYLETAEQYGLGHSKREAIDLRMLPR